MGQLNTPKPSDRSAVPKAMGLALTMACSGLMLPHSASGQEGAFRATLRGWAESTWLIVLDRNGSAGGRLSELGILQRFQPDIDDKYHIDLLTSAFSLTEDYDWYAKESGARWLGGSVTKRDLATSAEFKSAIALSDRWDFQIRFDHQDDPEAKRSAVRFGFRRRFGTTVAGFVQAHLDPNKPGSDLDLGFEWRKGGAQIGVALTAFDAFNDLIYLTLGAVNQTQIDSTLEYERQPLGVRTSIAVPLGASVRAEAYGAYVRPSTILAYEESDRTAGFRQDEQIAYAGGMVEWAPRTSVLFGGFATTVWAHSERDPLAAGVPVEAYRLTERTTQLGAFAFWRLSRRWLVDGWLRYTWRPEERVFPNGGSPDVDFMFRSFNSQALLTYTAPGGFRADVGVLTNRGRTPRGEGQVPVAGNFFANHNRFRFDAGWRFGDQMTFLVGGAVDVDLDREQTSFGGARGRFLLFW